MLLLSFLLLVFCFNSRLVFIQQTFRHGARYPAVKWFNDYPLQLLGELTAVGKRMHYLLGKKMYEQYWQQLGLSANLTNENIISVKSTDFNRTIESAQAHLYGLLKTLNTEEIGNETIDGDYWKIKSSMNLNSGAVFPENIYYHTMPIHVQKKQVEFSFEPDALLNYQDFICLNQKQWAKQNLKSDIYMRMDPLVKKYCNIITKQYDYGVQCNFQMLIMFVDVYHAKTALGQKVHWLFGDAQDTKNLLYIYTQGIYLKYFYDSLQIKATITPYFNLTLINLENAINNITPTKIQLFSAHDLTVMNILSALELVSSQCVEKQFVEQTDPNACIWQYPRYTSNIVFELIQQSKQYFVKVRYNGRYLSMAFCTQKTQCSYKQFKAHLQSYMLPDYRQTCGIQTQLKKMLAPQLRTSSYSSIQLIIALISVMFLVGVYFLRKAWDLYSSDDDQEQLQSIKHIEMDNIVK